MHAVPCQDHAESGSRDNQDRGEKALDNGHVSGGKRVGEHSICLEVDNIDIVPLFK